jgi:hypothetical protein
MTGASAANGTSVPSARRPVRPASRIVYRFHARDLHLVLGPGADGKPVRFKVLIDGQVPADAHGVDVAPDGTGRVTEQRLYQLVRQTDACRIEPSASNFLTRAYRPTPLPSADQESLK